MYRFVFVMIVTILPFHGGALASEKDQTKIESSKKEISEAEAKSIALALVPGKILEVEAEKHKGKKVFSVEIRGADGVHEILISVSDGSVIEDKLKFHDDDGDE